MKFAYDFVLFLDIYFPAIQNYYSLLYSLEADKIQIEIELNLLKQKCSVANDDLKEMTTKCHNLEDELMKEKLTNQYGQHYANIPSASKSINTVSQEVGQSMLK